MNRSFEKLEQMFYKKKQLAEKELSGLFDTIGIPADHGWRAIYQIIFDPKINVFGDNEPSTARTRLEPVMKTAVDTARNRDFSQSALLSLIREYNKTSYLICHNQLTDVINELDELTKEYKSSHMRKQKKVEALESETVSTVESDLSIEEKVKKIKARFRETISVFHEDMIKLDQMSNTDHLTRLYNRRFFDDQLSMEVTQALQEKTWLYLLMIDIDNFKTFNDVYGHLVGDQALKIIAKNIQISCCEESEKTGIEFFPTRYGGEEFAVILPAIDEKQTRQVAEKIRKRVNDYIFVIRSKTGKIKHKNLNLTVSIGMAALDHRLAKKPAAKELIKNADAALYAAKKAGKNCVRSLQP